MYKFLRALFIGFLKVFFPYKVINKSRADVDGAFVVIANHRSNFDAFRVGVCFKEKIYFLGKKEWFEKRFFKKLLTTLGGIPVDRGNVDLNAVKTCLKTLKDGKKLAVFPEGTRNKTEEELLPVKSGAAVMAVKAKVNLLPVYVSGENKLFKKVKIFVGETVSLQDYFGLKITKDLEDKLCDVTLRAILDTKAEFDSYLKKEKEVKKRK